MPLKALFAVRPIATGRPPAKVDPPKNVLCQLAPRPHLVSPRHSNPRCRRNICCLCLRRLNFGLFLLETSDLDTLAVTELVSPEVRFVVCPVVALVAGVKLPVDELVLAADRTGLVASSIRLGFGLSPLDGTGAAGVGPGLGAGVVVGVAGLHGLEDVLEEEEGLHPGEGRRGVHLVEVDGEGLHGG